MLNNRGEKLDALEDQRRTGKPYADGGEEDAADARQEENNNEADAARADELLALGNGATADDKRLCPDDEEVRPHGADAWFGSVVGVNGVSWRVSQE